MEEQAHREGVQISIHALREEGDADNYNKTPTLSQISIHALREEGDALTEIGDKTGKISIHALREEGDQAIMQGVYNHIEFLSTPSARRATI